MTKNKRTTSPVLPKAVRPVVTDSGVYFVELKPRKPRPNVYQVSGDNFEIVPGRRSDFPREVFEI